MKFGTARNSNLSGSSSTRTRAQSTSAACAPPTGPVRSSDPFDSQTRSGFMGNGERSRTVNPRILFLVASDYEDLLKKGVTSFLQEREEDGFFEQVITLHPWAG